MTQSKSTTTPSPDKSQTPEVETKRKQLDRGDSNEARTVNLKTKFSITEERMNSLLHSKGQAPKEDMQAQIHANLKKENGRREVRIAIKFHVSH